MICPVSRCKGETKPGWSICAVDAENLRENLAEIPALLDALEGKLARLAGRGFAEARGESEKPPPYDQDAREAIWVLRNTLVGWIRDLEPDPDDHPADSVPAMARWLLGRHHQLVVHPAAEEIVAEIAAAVGRPADRRPKCIPDGDEPDEYNRWGHAPARLGWTLVDNRAPSTFLGPCPTCGAAGMYAAENAAEATCPSCDTVHEVDRLRSGLEDALDDRLVTAAEYASMLVVLGESIDRKRVRTMVNVWAVRGRVVVHAGPPVRYRFGELRERHTEDEHRRTVRRAT